jgi:hypothetical protein
MSKLEVVRYEAARRREWDEFVADSKNGVFLFRRDYVEYHADRFPDASLMFYEAGGRLAALLPATEAGGLLSSHGGLTFGGVVSGDRMKVGLMLEVFDAMREHLRARGVTRVVYKAVPHIYHRAPAEEDLYALFRHGARLTRRDVSATLDMAARLPFGKGREYSIRKARRLGLEVGRSFDFAKFMAIEEELLREKYGARPVHTAAEIALLAGRFPDHIKLFAAARGEEMQAGVIIYESERVAHAQYIGSTPEGREAGAPDLIMDYLINDYYARKKYFDFGISTEEGGRRLNAGLVENKQGFGGRAVVYDFYELDIN